MFFRLMDLECSLVPPDFGAVATVRRLRPDVVILDLDLPGLRALEIARELRELPMILLTDRDPDLLPIHAPAMRNPRDRFEELLRLFELVLDIQSAGRSRQ